MQVLQSQRADRAGLEFAGQRIRHHQEFERRQRVQPMSCGSDRAAGDQHPRAAVLEHVRKLAGTQAGIERHEDGADTAGGKGQFDGLGPVGQVHGDSIAARDAKPRETRRQPQGGSAHLGVGRRRGAIAQCHGIRRGARASIQQLVQHHLGVMLTSRRATRA